MKKLYGIGTKQKLLWRHPLLLAMLAASLPVSADIFDSADVTLNINGTLRKPACQLAPGDEVIPVDMDTINARDLDNGGQSPAVPFTVNLLDCEADIDSSSVTFTGEQAEGDDTLLAIDASSEAGGFGIGFMLGSTKVPMGKPLDHALDEGDNSIEFSAYTKKLPDAELVMGDFTATTGLVIKYN